MDWTFEGTWPYEPHWFPSPDGVIHYVDEGPRGGRPIVLLHGNPTWGYLFRRLIPSLNAAGHRAVVPDHLGFGRSAKPGGAGHYELTRHVERLALLLDSLDLRDAVLVPHDWGGPIGLRWAADNPDRVAGLFILNTVAHAVERGQLRVPAPLRLIRTRGLGEVAVKGLDAFKPLMLRLAIERRDLLKATHRSAYRSVHRSWSERTGMLAFARQLPIQGSGPVNEINAETERALARQFGSKPTRIIWGERDLVLPPDLLGSLWLRTLPAAEVTRIPDAGHFLPEDVPDYLASELVRFVGAL